MTQLTTITPEMIRIRRSEAAFVQERLDRALQLDTDQRRQEYEWAQQCFTDKYHCKWQDWAPQQTERAR